MVTMTVPRTSGLPTIVSEAGIPFRTSSGKSQTWRTAVFARCGVNELLQVRTVIRHVEFECASEQTRLPAQWEKHNRVSLRLLLLTLHLVPFCPRRRGDD